jgi:hypothetical protein
VKTPRFCEPAPVDPSQSWYSATPLPADHVNVTEEPGSTLPGAGLIIAPGALAGASAMPVPLRLTTGFPEVALLVSVRLPVAAPTDVGVNCKLTAYEPPAANVTGMLLCPITENGPVTLTPEICTAAALSFLTETDALDVCPNATLPKESEFADATRLPLAALAMMLPHPDSRTETQLIANASAPAHHICFCSRRFDFCWRIRLPEDAWTTPRADPAEGTKNIECIYLTSCKTKSVQFLRTTFQPEAP